MKRYDEYVKSWGSNWTVGRFLLPILANWGRGEREVVLDLGCGESPFRHFFGEARRYVAVDWRPVAKGMVVADANLLPLTERSVDTVLVFQLLGDVAEPKRLLREIRRVLRRGGEVIVFETMAYPEHDLPHDYFRIMPQGLRQIAQASGLENTDMMRLGGLFTRLADLWNVGLMGPFLRWPGSVWLARGGIMLVNIAAYWLDRFFARESFAPDYVARLVRAEEGPV